MSWSVFVVVMVNFACSSPRSSWSNTYGTVCVIGQVECYSHELMPDTSSVDCEDHWFRSETLENN